MIYDIKSKLFQSYTCKSSYSFATSSPSRESSTQNQTTPKERVFGGSA
jgi:hypothetical protein